MIRVSSLMADQSEEQIRNKRLAALTSSKSNSTSSTNIKNEEMEITPPLSITSKSTSTLMDIDIKKPSSKFDQFLNMDHNEWQNRTLQHILQFKVISLSIDLENNLSY